MHSVTLSGGPRRPGRGRAASSGWDRLVVRDLPVSQSGGRLTAEVPVHVADHRCNVDRPLVLSRGTQGEPASCGVATSVRRGRSSGAAPRYAQSPNVYLSVGCSTDRLGSSIAEFWQISNERSDSQAAQTIAATPSAEVEGAPGKDHEDPCRRIRHADTWELSQPGTRNLLHRSVGQDDRTTL